VLACVADAFDRCGIAEQIADARDENADAVLCICGLRTRTACSAEDLFCGEAFASATEKLYDERLEGTTTLERDLAVEDAKAVRDRVDDEGSASRRRGELRLTHA